MQDPRQFATKLALRYDDLEKVPAIIKDIKKYFVEHPGVNRSLPYGATLDGFSAWSVDLHLLVRAFVQRPSKLLAKKYRACWDLTLGLGARSVGASLVHAAVSSQKCSRPWPCMFLWATSHICLSLPPVCNDVANSALRRRPCVVNSSAPSQAFSVWCPLWQWDESYDCHAGTHHIRKVPGVHRV